jgi:hypothetical protein
MAEAIVHLIVMHAMQCCLWLLLSGMFIDFLLLAQLSVANWPPHSAEVLTFRCCLLLMLMLLSGCWSQQAAASCCWLGPRLSPAACGAHGLQPEPASGRPAQPHDLQVGTKGTHVCTTSCDCMDASVRVCSFSHIQQAIDASPTS